MDRIDRILDRLGQGETLISDGATGTYLQGHGLEPGGCPEAFNVSHADVVRGMAREYFEAGADMVLTNSFGGSRFMLGKYGLADRVGEFNRLAAEHVRSEAPEGCYVVGSVGPTGEFLEPLGELSESEMLDGFAEQIGALVAGGVDAVVVETMTALEESALAIRAAREYSSQGRTGLTVMATYDVRHRASGVLHHDGGYAATGGEGASGRGRGYCRGKLRERDRGQWWSLRGSICGRRRTRRCWCIATLGYLPCSAERSCTRSRRSSWRGGSGRWWRMWA